MARISVIFKVLRNILKKTNIKKTIFVLKKLENPKCIKKNYFCIKKTPKSEMY